MIPMFFAGGNGIIPSIPSNNQHRNTNNGVFWIGRDGNVWVKGSGGTNSAGRADGNTISYWTSRGFSQIADPVAPRAQANNANGSGSVFRRVGGGYYTGGGGGAATPPKKLDEAQIGSLRTLLSQIDTVKDRAVQKASAKRTASINEKNEEKNRETKKRDTKKIETEQDFNDSRNQTDVTGVNTLNNLISSVSTLGLGNKETLVRQILDKINQANRKSNSTLAKNRQSIDSAYNTYMAGYDNDIKKINDQFSYDVGEANKTRAQQRQNTLYRMADVYGNGGLEAERNNMINEGNSLSHEIANAPFVNPSYTGEVRTMATPELNEYTANIGSFTPTPGLVANGVVEATPGVAIQALADTDKDYGVKRHLEDSKIYGV